MPPFVAALLGGLVQIAGTLAGRVLVALGFASVTYTGISSTLGWLKTSVVEKIQLLPPEVIQIFAVTKVGVALSIITSAYSARMLLEGLSAGGSISKLIKR